MDMYSLEPRPVWKHFFKICSIPHPSHHEDALAEAIVDWAAERGFEASRDSAGNVVIRKAAIPGRESVPGVILQAHLDMVPQAASGVEHSFTEDPIRPRFDPGDPAWLMASGTTLGADNGIGVAIALAIIEDKALSHGPLECLFTVNEEDGMSGARAVEEGLLSGTVLLNLDGEDDDELTFGCAGAIRTASELRRPAIVPPHELAWFEASVEGLLGGHSGVDINKGRANAALVLADLLVKIRSQLYIASMQGGSAANAIPRDARAIVGIAQDKAQLFQSTFMAEAIAQRLALGNKDPGLKAGLLPLAEDRRPSLSLDPEASDSMLTTLGALPNGLVAMEPDMPGLIRTSLNLGQLSGVCGEDGLFRLNTVVMVRSSSDEEKENLAATVEKRLAGATDHGWTVQGNRPSESPAWSPNQNSPLLAKARSLYRELFGKDPKVTSTHGGLETGLFRPRFPSWDMLSIGPTIRYPHSPDERVLIASVPRSYHFVRALIERQ